MEFRETLPSPHALRSVAEGIQMKQPGTRIHKETKTSREEVKSNLEKKPRKTVQRLVRGSQLRRTCRNNKSSPRRFALCLSKEETARHSGNTMKIQFRLLFLSSASNYSRVLREHSGSLSSQSTAHRIPSRTVKAPMMTDRPQ